MSLREALREAKRAYLVKVLTQARGNVVHAARMAGVHRQSFYRMLNRYGISCESLRRSCSRR